MAPRKRSSPPPDRPPPPLWKVWMIACRPHTLTASISPVLVGHFLLTDNKNHSTLLWLFFCIFIQLATNLHNDFADYIKGADNDSRVGQARAVQKKWLSVDAVGRASSMCVVVAIIIYIHLLYTTRQFYNLLLWFILTSSCFNAFGYTGGPVYCSPCQYYNLQLSIGYSGLGDVVCFLYFGLVAVMMLPYLESLEKQQNYDFRRHLLVATPVGFLATAILVVNNLRDRHTDVRANKRTLAVRFGATFCRIEYVVLVVGSYVLLFVLYTYYYNQSMSLLLPLLSIPIAVWNIRAMFTKEGRDLNKHVGGTAMLQFVYCVLLCVGMRQHSSI